MCIFRSGFTLKKTYNGNIPHDLQPNETFRNYRCFHLGITFAVCQKRMSAIKNRWGFLIQCFHLLQQIYLSGEFDNKMSLLGLIHTGRTERLCGDWTSAWCVRKIQVNKKIQINRTARKLREERKMPLLPSALDSAHISESLQL